MVVVLGEGVEHFPLLHSLDSRVLEEELDVGVRLDHLLQVGQIGQYELQGVILGGGGE